MSYANISIQRNRVKVYPNNTVYLQDKQEFQIELFNSTTITRLAKIAINGQLISQTGIVVQPGQRIYLERYIDSPRKFSFQTYVVDADNQAVDQAIVNNGLVQVYWYDEKPAQIYPSTITINTTQYPHYNYPYNQFFTTSSNISNAISGSSNTTTSYSAAFNAKSTPTMDLFESDSSTTMDWIEQTKERGRAEKISATKETGKVGQGNYSNQQFTQYSGDFYSTICATTTIKILPLSAKPLEAKDLAAYCTGCGTKNKGGKFKYCPTCGTKY